MSGLVDRSMKTFRCYAKLILAFRRLKTPPERQALLKFRFDIWRQRQREKGFG